MQQFKKEKFLNEELKNLDQLHFKDCNIMYNKFHEKYLQIIDRLYLIKYYQKVSKKEMKLKLKPQISKAILTSPRDSSKHFFRSSKLQNHSILN